LSKEHRAYRRVAAPLAFPQQSAGTSETACATVQQTAPGHYLSSLDDSLQKSDVGCVVFLVGFAGCAQSTWQWVVSGFGRLFEIRHIFSGSCGFLGAQVISWSFFLSILGISREMLARRL
jgi:hypothetical protein